jgi:hypothetical protein
MREKTIAFQDAENLVYFISDHLDAGTRHFRTKAGRLLLTLDEVIRAILSGEFDPATLGQPMKQVHP